MANAPTAATDWLVLVRENPADPVIRQAFEQWISRSTENQREWEKTVYAWQALGHVNVGLRTPAHHQGRTAKIWGSATGAALLLCLALFWGPQVLMLLQADYLTGTAESRTVTLSDGSEIALAPKSAIVVSFSPGRRNVTLLQGEAFFEVQRDETRPFEVTSGGLAITVLGTGFDVSLGDGTSSVGLAHGSVRASTAADQRILQPGEIVTFNETTGTLSEERANVKDIGLWRDGRLSVTNQTIGSVIEQIRRYHPAWIALPDPTLAAQRVTGIYDLRSPDDALGALVDPYGGRVRKISSVLRVVSRL